MVSIRSIQFDESLVKGWSLLDDHERGTGWVDSDLTSSLPSMGLAIDWNPTDFLYSAEDIKSDLELFRADRVQKANEQGMALLEHEIVTNRNSLTLIRVIEKKPMKPQGMAYYGTLTLLNEASGFLFQIWSFEVGTTGIRDSMVLNEFMAGGTFNPGKEDWGGWMIDPYGFGNQTPMMHNVSELPEYDARFPDHPLSKLRYFQSRIIDSLVFDPNTKFSCKGEPKKSTSWFQKWLSK